MEDGTIKLNDIRFTYPTKSEIEIIKGPCINVQKNKTVALVGSSGSGKSTIIQLIERFYDPKGGNIEYGDQDLKTLNPAKYKERMAIVMQEPILFSGSIRDNIVYGLNYEAS